MILRIASRSPASSEAIVVIDGHRLPKKLKAEFARQWQAGPVAVTATLGLMDAPLAIGLRPPVPGEAFWNDAVAIGKLFGAAGGTMMRQRVSSATVLLPDAAAPAVTSILLALGRAIYAFDRYRSSKSPPLPKVTVLPPDRSSSAAARRALPIVSGITLARDLVNTPAEDMGPDELEQAARTVAKQSGLKVRVLDAARCKRLGMGALTAVGRASPRPPRLVVLEHHGAPRSTKFLALAGKGICFDTGGLNLKGTAGMLVMKKDMGGAASVLGAAKAIGALAPKRNVRFYLAVAENSVAGNSIRPGDVVRAMDGTTIEIGNTDAEGRLVLADAVAFARSEGATRIVDVATLTGAALIALGRIRVPLLGNDETLLSDMERAADAAGERLWRMPTDPEYMDGIRGEIADLRNVGPPSEFGVMAGGLFIGHFAGDTPWAHLDISPASWAPAPHDLGPAGATGTMVATLTRLALDS